MANNILDEFNALPDAPEETSVERAPTSESSLADEFSALPDAPADETSLTPETSMLDSGADASAGLIQGISLNFADEIAGAAKASGQSVWDFIKGEKGKSWVENYRKNQKDIDAEFKMRKKRSPWLYGSGELGGAVALGYLTAGMSAPATGAVKTAQAAEIAAQGVNATRPFWAPLLKNTVKGAAAAGTYGGIAGFGGSEGDLDSEAGRKKLYEDTKSSAKVGAVLGGGMSALATTAGFGANKLKDKIAQTAEESPIVRQTVKAFDEGLSGKRIADLEPEVDRLAQEGLDQVSDISKRFIGAEDEVGSQLNKVIQKATESGAKIQATPKLATTAEGVLAELPEYASIIGKEQSDDITRTLADLLDGYATPQEIQNLRKSLGNLYNTENPGVRGLVKRLDNELKTALTEQVPDFAKQSTMFNKLRSAGSETLLAKGLPADLADNWVGDLTKGDKKIAENVKWLLEKITSPGTSKMDARRTAIQLENNLLAFEKEFPGFLKQHGLHPENLMDDLIKYGDDWAIQKQALGYEPQGNPLASVWTMMGGGANTGRGQLVQKANMLGRGVKTVKDWAGKSTPVQISKRLYEMPDEGLRAVADKLQSIEGLGTVGKALLKSIDNKDKALKNAAMFTILQNPKARAAFSENDDNE